MNRLYKRAATVVASTMALGVGGIGYAFWTATGAGTASQGTITTTPITILQTSGNSTAALYPGGSTIISGTFSNPNAADVRVNTVTAALTTSLVPAGCVEADFTLSSVTIPTNLSIPGKTSTGPGLGGTWSLTMTMRNTDVSQDACKVATIPLTLSSS